MSSPAQGPVGLDLAALDGLTDAVECGAGLPAVIRAASRALDASVVCLARGGSVLAVAARSPADERVLVEGGAGTESLELRVGDAPVGSLRVRAGERRGRGTRGGPAGPPPPLRPLG